jgi:transaldolase
MTVVVADSGDFDSFTSLKPQDATTNPSLLYKAAMMEKYQHLVQDAINYAKNLSNNQSEIVTITLDRLAINFGREILNIVPGRVSTEIDARLSYDTEQTIEKCRVLANMYREIGVDPTERVLFKIASTWEGIKAAEILEQEGFHTNLTLLFSFAQAVACAEAGVTLISPFVGRILDFWKKESGKSSYPIDEDPGVVSVTSIYNYYKKYGYKTIVMGASFRSVDEILALAGCDYLTISPNFLVDLDASQETVERKLDPNAAETMEIPRVTYDEKSFRWALGADACGTAKLAEGIRGFAADTIKLEELIVSLL